MNKELIKAFDILKSVYFENAYANIELNKTEENSVRKLLKENNCVMSFDEIMIEKSKFSDYRNNFLKEPTLYM